MQYSYLTHCTIKVIGLGNCIAHKWFKVLCCFPGTCDPSEILSTSPFKFGNLQFKYLKSIFRAILSNAHTVIFIAIQNDLVIESFSYFSKFLFLSYAKCCHQCSFSKTFHLLNFSIKTFHYNSQEDNQKFGNIYTLKL